MRSLGRRTDHPTRLDLFTAVTAGRMHSGLFGVFHYRSRCPRCFGRGGPRRGLAGVTIRYAALEIATGRVVGRCTPTHTGADFLAFLKRLAGVYPGRALHCIVDNSSTHSTPAVAGGPSAGAPAVHPDRGLVAEPRRGLVQHPDAHVGPPRVLRDRAGLDPAHRALHR